MKLKKGVKLKSGVKLKKTSKPTPYKERMNKVRQVKRTRMA